MNHDILIYDVCIKYLRNTEFLDKRQGLYFLDQGATHGGQGVFFLGGTREEVEFGFALEK